MRRVREADSILEQTINNFKKNNETLISQAGEEDLQ